MTSGCRTPIRSSPSAPLAATSTRWAGAGNAWRTCPGSRAGSSSMSNRWAMLRSPGTPGYGPDYTAAHSAFYSLSRWSAQPGHAGWCPLPMQSAVGSAGRRAGPVLFEALMHETPRARLVAYGVALLATGVSLLLRWLLWPAIGDHTPFMTFFPAVILSAFVGGLGPGLVATFVSAAAAAFFLLRPHFSFAVHDLADALSLGLFTLTGVVLSVLSESLHRSRRRILASERRYAVTLASIGDAVIATDTQAGVTFLNPAAEALTGWPLADAAGRPLAEVFRIVNEQTRQPAEDPAAKVLRLGTVVGLANHTALLARDGRETPIDDCGAPILADRGAVAGVVLVFRDVTQRRRAEEAEAIRRANERLELAVRGSNVGVWESEAPHGDPRDTRQHYVNFWEQLG